MDLMIEDLMEQLVQGGGSDLHLATGQPPYGRFSGELRPMTERLPLALITLQAVALYLSLLAPQPKPLLCLLPMTQQMRIMKRLR